MAATNRLLIALLPLLLPAAAQEAVLEVGVPYRGRLEAPVIPTASPTAISLKLVLEQETDLTLDLRSLAFDPWIRLMDESGDELAADEDGGPGWQAMIRGQSMAAGKYLVQVGAQNDAVGSFELRCLGAVMELTPEQIREWEEVNSRAMVDYARRRLSAQPQLMIEALDQRASMRIGYGEWSASVEDLEMALQLQGEAQTAAPMQLGRLWVNLGYCRSQLGWNDSAVDAYRQGCASWEQGGPDAATLGLTFNSLALELSLLGRHEEAREAWQRGLDLVQSQGSDAQRQLLQVRNVEALMAGEEGSFEEEVRLHQEVLRQRRELLGPEADEVLTSLENLGKALTVIGDFESARAVLEESLALTTRRHGLESRLAAESQLALAHLLIKSGDLERAEKLLRQSRATYEAVVGLDNSNLQAWANALAITLDRMGRHREARIEFETALDLARTHSGDDSLDAATASNNFGNFLYDQLQYEAAYAHCNTALTILEQKVAADHPDLVPALNNLGLILLDSGELPRALEYFQRCLAIRLRVLPSPHAEISEAYNNLGVVELGLGNLEEARHWHTQQIAMDQQLYATDHLMTSYGWHNLGYVEDAAGNLQKARDCFAASLRLRLDLLGPDHPLTISDEELLVYVEMDLGNVEQSVRHALAALESRERHFARTQGGFTSSERQAWLTDFRSSFRWLLATGAHLHSDSELRHDLLNAVLRWKSLVSRTVGSSWVNRLFDSHSDTRTLVLDLQLTSAALSQAWLRSQDASKLDDLQRLTQLREDQERELLSLLDSPRASRAFGIDELRQALPPGAAWVGMADYSSYQPARLQNGSVIEAGTLAQSSLEAWVVTEKDLFQITLADLESVMDAVPAWSQVRGRGGRTLEATSNDPLADCRHLHQLLWQPLAEVLADYSTIVVSMPPSLAGLPMGILLGENDRFLVEDHRFLYLPDPSDLAASRTSLEHPSPSLLSVGGLDYSAAPTEDSIAGQRTGELQTWLPLRHAGDEAAAVQSLHQQRPGAGPSLLLTASEAIEQRLKTEMGGHQVVHLATHAFFLSQREAALGGLDRFDETGQVNLREGEAMALAATPGLLSGLVCTGANTRGGDQEEDGLLTAEEISWLDLSAVDLVVLSACETALGRSEAGLGMVSLQRAFLDAGARTVVASLWPVDDLSTRLLMESFYGQLWQQGQGRLDALHQAQRQILQQQRQGSGGVEPALWGAFVLSGAWR